MVVTEIVTRYNSMELKFPHNALIWMNTYIKANDKFQEHKPCWMKNTIQQIENW